MKKRGIVIGMVVVVLVMMVSPFVLSKTHLFRVTPMDTDGKVFGDQYYESIELLNNELKTHIYVYGDDIVFDTDVKYTKLDDLSQFNISEDDDYTILIVNDDKTDYNIGDDQWTQINNLLEKNRTFFFYYYGVRSQKNLISNGIFDDNTFMTGDLCTGRVLKKGKRWI